MLNIDRLDFFTWILCRLKIEITCYAEWPNDAVKAAFKRLGIPDDNYLW